MKGEMPMELAPGWRRMGKGTITRLVGRCLFLCCQDNADGDNGNNNDDDDDGNDDDDGDDNDGCNNGETLAATTMKGRRLR